MNTLKELQVKAIHGMLGSEDFLDFRDSLYKTLIVAKYKNLNGSINSNDGSIGLSRKECHLVETCLEIYESFDIADEYCVAQTFYLLKSLLLHFEVIGLKEFVEMSGHTGLNQDVIYKTFAKENVIDKIDVLKTYLNNMNTFTYCFSIQKKTLEKHCRQEFSECYEIINGLCEG